MEYNEGEVVWLVVVYGSCSRDPADYEERFPENKAMDQRRAEVQLRPKPPATHMDSLELLSKYMEDLARNIGVNIKHSRNWRCEFCSMFPRSLGCLLAYIKAL